MQLNSKEALEYICKTCDNKSCPWKHYEKSRCAFYGVIKQDLDRLEKLEKDFEELKELNQFNYKSVKCEEHNYKLLENEYIKLEKENQELKERYKHRAETSNDLCKAVKQYEKVIEILVNKRVNIVILKYCIEKGCGIDTYNLYYTTEEQLTQEEYELLKGVLEK